MREIALSNSGIALVDAEDYPSVASHGWWGMQRNCDVTYAVSNFVWHGRKRRVYMHRFIVEPAPRIGIDHANGDGLDNRRSNLRIANDSENAANRHSLSKNTSGFRGVTLHRQTNRWQAQIKKLGRNVYLGLFDTREEAALAYDNAAKDLFGAFARPNFSEPAA